MALTLPLALLVRLAAAPAPPLEVRADAVDPGLTETGLRARAGSKIEGWTITVDAASEPHTVDVRLRAPDGSIRRRRLALTGETTEDRSRELAASLTLLIEEPGDPPVAPPPPPVEPAPPPPPPRPAIRGWLGLGPRVELGRSVLVEAGGDLIGGAWLLREHLQPLASLGLTGAGQGGVALLHARLGAGLAVGAALPDRRIWLGGHVLTHALWVRAHDVTTAATWLSSTQVGGLVQYRGQRLVLGLHTGVDLTFPGLSVRGARGPIRRSSARWVLGLVVGVAFG